MNIPLKLESVLERDIDLMLLEEFNVSLPFVEWFAKQCNMPFDNIENATASHSIVKDNGESDIVLSYIAFGQHYKIMIENKIDAPAQVFQAQRYIERAKDEECDRIEIVIIAPQEYLDKNAEAQKYPYQVPYEIIAEYFAGYNSMRGKYRADMLHQAIDKTRRGYIAKKDDIVTAFWQKYYDELMKTFPDDAVMKYPDKKPADSDWPHIKFRNMPSKWFIQHKMSQGDMDVVTTFSAQEALEFSEILKSLQQGCIKKVGKAYNLRIPVPKLDRRKDFEQQIGAVKKCFSALSALKLITR